MKLIDKIFLAALLLLLSSNSHAEAYCHNESSYTLTFIRADVDMVLHEFEEIIATESKNFYSFEKIPVSERTSPLNYTLQYPIGSKNLKISGEIPVTIYSNCYTGSTKSRSMQFEMEIALIRMEFLSTFGIHAAYSQSKHLKPEFIPRGAYQSTIAFPAPNFYFSIRGTEKDAIEAFDYYLNIHRSFFERFVSRPSRFAPYETSLKSDLNDPQIYNWTIDFQHFNNLMYTGSDLSKFIAFETDMQDYRRNFLLEKFGVVTELHQPKIITDFEAKYDELESKQLDTLTDYENIKTTLQIRNHEITVTHPELEGNTILSRASKCETDNQIFPTDNQDVIKDKTENLIACLVGEKNFKKAKQLGDNLENVKSTYSCIENSIFEKDTVECLQDNDLIRVNNQEITAITSCSKDINPEKCLGISLLTDDQKYLANDLNCFANASTNESKLACLQNSSGSQTTQISTCLSSVSSREEKFLCAVEGKLGKNETAAVNVARCLNKAQTNTERLDCAAKGNLGKKERQALNVAKCATSSNSYVGAATCLFGENLTDEQKIFLECASTTASLGPKAYAACAAGKLTEKELSKCLEGGFGTKDGCFGKNNFFRLHIENVRREACNAVGNDKKICGVLTYIVDNAIMPGENHEVVKYFNHGLSDIRNGPSKNNEYVKAVRQAEKLIQDVDGNVSQALANIERDIGQTKHNIDNTLTRAKSDLIRETENMLQNANTLAQAPLGLGDNIVDGAQIMSNNLNQNVEHYLNEGRKETQKVLDKFNNALGIGSGGIKF
ncbi:hypothetical protein [Methylophaga thalassica]|uniref:hypothetical protein n=1 Tax=Methylophaga thalassica TaxID=40223 RepID=UPI002E7AD1B4|nr:hypothetical protein [Methylophaga thalassica]WVI83632.1 hypothetical protein VSX76_00875 [Methylophaga thalassica]